MWIADLVLLHWSECGYWQASAILSDKHFPIVKRKLPRDFTPAPVRPAFMDATLHSDQNIRILQVYNVYRLALSVILLATFLTNPISTQLGNLVPDVFLRSALTYTTFSLLVLMLFRGREHKVAQQRLLSTLFIGDILALTVLSHTSSGVESGLALLLLVTIAAASLLLRKRMSTFLAAIATLAIIFSEVYLNLRVNVPANQYIQAGLLGALLLAASIYLESLAERMRLSAQLTAAQASSILNLEQLNQLIITRMRTGILVVDAAENVLTANDAALRMLRLASGESNSNPANADHVALPTVLRQQLTQWRTSPGRRLPTFGFSKSSPQIQANFAYLTSSSESSILIFLEDSSQMIQRVRQMKLASLGRLTASIAHEIRNPLGAISHASQLLEEAPALAPPEKRLIEIILNHCARVNHIIEDVLQMSRQRQEASERVNLFDWLTQFVEAYRSTHELNGNITIVVTPPETEVRVIISQLEQILNNLFENGLRYSALRTGITNLTLEGGMTGPHEQQVPFLNVIDDGPGVDHVTEEHLFEPFHTTENSGTGLGLYISKELCEANQAQLSYRRTDSGKSCFSIHFPNPDRNMD